MKTLVRIGAVAFAGVAITMAALGMRDAGHGAAQPLTPALAPRETNALQGELLRCQAMGQAGAGDAGCLRVWAENRRRFLGLSGRQQASLPGQAIAVETKRSAALMRAMTPGSGAEN